jgi:hypothetical protein
MELWELAAREGVRDTIAAYADAGDRLRLDDLAETFATDGVLEVKGRAPATGREAIVAMLRDPSSRPRPSSDPFFIRHFITNVRFVSVTPDEVHSTAYFLVLTPDGPDHWGRYRDRLARVGDEWLFTHRLVAVDAAVEGSWFSNPL